MAKCRTCKKIVLFGGKADGEYRYCNQKCLDEDLLRETSEMLPQHLVDERVHGVHQGRCPQCKKDQGPVDVHWTYSLWTFIYFTQIRSHQLVCCRSCARQGQFWASVRSLFLGVWGPIGILMTPVQILRNISAMIGGPPPYAPSALLFQLIRRVTAEEILQNASIRSRLADEDASPAENVGDDPRRDDRGVRLDDVLRDVDSELASRNRLVGNRA
jgi:hypothetical protein